MENGDATPIFSSKGNALTCERREFDSQFDALNFAHDLASFSGNTNITLQAKVGKAWKLVLGFTSGLFDSEKKLVKHSP
ncbi:MAG: hypothetical protein LAO21_17745 [Acidobacteriia bacterium]|nr:hypothetical protein [Terriglobia bacterium]